MAEYKAGTKIRLLVTFSEPLNVGTFTTRVTYKAGAVGEIQAKEDADRLNRHPPDVHYRRWFSDPYAVYFNSPLVVDADGRPIRMSGVPLDSSEFQVIA